MAQRLGDDPCAQGAGGGGGSEPWSIPYRVSLQGIRCRVQGLGIKVRGSRSPGHVRLIPEETLLECTATPTCTSKTRDCVASRRSQFHASVLRHRLPCCTMNPDLCQPLWSLSFEGGARGCDCGVTCTRRPRDLFAENLTASFRLPALSASQVDMSFGSCQD